ncbi:histidine phosphatase family protein [Pseudomonas taiwanensis]|uniref:histidine phosphatase family protein n=1 Tax=Pseudomonas taiwanensis TaxID=470150 RepID=UPI0015C1A0B0|nr:histidine phosphatase family protein [Pseudomonas taiwanensis]NWL77709.1 histidine phosphatase family protein [Pseudomonas taiwanensis]
MHAESDVRRRRCYLVRHGHVDYFDALGRPLDPRTVALSRTGTQQAWALGQVLQDVQFDRVLCSDYPRARQTLDLLLQGNQVPVESMPELREIRAGRLREIPAEALREQVVGAYRAAGVAGARFLGGERWDDFQRRVLSLFFELLQDPGWDSALIVSHDAVNRILLGWAAGLGLAGIAAFEQDTACLNVLDIDMRGDQVLGALIRTLNFTPYDPHKAGIHGTVLENLFLAIEPAGLRA